MSSIEAIEAAWMKAREKYPVQSKTVPRGTPEPFGGQRGAWWHDWMHLSRWWPKLKCLAVGDLGPRS